MKAWVQAGETDTERKARERLVMEQMSTLTSGIDESGELLTEKQFRERLKELETIGNTKSGMSKRLKAEKGTLRYQLDDVEYDEAKTYGKKQAKFGEALEKQLEQHGIDVEDRKTGEKDEVYFERVQKLALAEDDKRAKDNKIFTEEGRGAVEEGVTRSAAEWLQDIFTMIDNWIKGQPNK